MRTLRETYIDLIYMGSRKRQDLLSKLGARGLWVRAEERRGGARRKAEKNRELNKKINKKKKKKKIIAEEEAEGLEESEDQRVCYVIVSLRNVNSYTHKVS